MGKKKLEPNELGVLEWNKELKSGEKLELKLKFSVEYQRDRQIIDLE